MEHVCVSELNSHGLSPIRQQAIAWANADLSPIGSIYAQNSVVKLEFKYHTVYPRECIWKSRESGGHDVFVFESFQVC